MSWLGCGCVWGVWGAPRKISRPAVYELQMFRYHRNTTEFLVICVVLIFRAVSDKFAISRCCCYGVPSAVVSTLAGSTTSGSADGVGTSAQFNAPHGVSVDSSGNVIVGDSNNNMIRKISPTGIAA